MKTMRQRMQAAINGEAADSLPACFRLNLWLNACRLQNTLPKTLAGLSDEDVYRSLSLPLPARKARVFQTSLDEKVKYDKQQDGLTETELWITPAGTLRRVTQYEPGWKELGMQPRVVEYPIRTAEDYAAYIHVMEAFRFQEDYASYSQYDSSIGDDGLPMVILGPCPAHDLMLKWVGYENAFFHIIDIPGAFSDAVRAGNNAYRQMWSIIANSPCELVMHGVNFDTGMTSPPIFREHFQPYLQEFIEEMHQADIKVAFHGDGDMSGLLDLMLELDYDVADCFACAPMVRCTFDQAREAWENRIVIWGGVPSNMLDTTTSIESLTEHLDMIQKSLGSNRSHFILGISDQAMPTSSWKHIMTLLEWIQA